MKSLILSTLALLACGAASVSSTPNKVVGDYVEARTASVFAGACHYNGEVVTVGRDAVMAWRFASGAWNGTDLAGVRVAAAVSSKANLADENAARKVEIVVDSAATDAQATAVVALLREKRLGEIVALRRASVAFDRVDGAFVVKADGFAKMSVRPMPNGECCAQPNLVWYSPLVPVQQRKVGYTEAAAYTAGNVGDRWQHEGEDSAFYGRFEF